MATAKATNATAKAANEQAVKEVFATEALDAVAERGKLFKFESNGKSKYLKKGKRYLLTAELYKLFVKKEYKK